MATKISASMVKELREKTGVGMMDAKKALVEKDGNMEEAISFLKEKGLAASAKKASRIAAEGLVTVISNEDNTRASIVEVNCETDFVGKNENFKTYVAEVASFVNENKVDSVETLMTMKKDDETFEEKQSSLVATIGEKISTRRFETLEADYVHSYLHSNSRVAAVVTFKADETLLSNDKFKTLAKNLSMHIASMKPSKLTYKELDMEFVEEETKGAIERVKKENEERARLGKHLFNIPEFISKAQLTEEILAKVEKQIKQELLDSGKPEKILDKILPGKMERFIADNTSLDQEYCLLDQFYALDDKKTVSQVIEEKIQEFGANFEVTSFVRYEVGDGLEKRQENFAEEVAAQMK
jgi:elongation factor Ts